MYKLYISISIIISVTFLTSFTSVLAQEYCPLTPLKAYKSPKLSAVWYVSEDCTKRPIRNPDVFFSHFTSWSDVRVVSDGVLARIANHELGFLPWGPRRTYKNGSLLKTVDDARVYLVLNDKKYPIESENIFLGLGYSFDQVEDVFAEVLIPRVLQQTISTINDYPSNLIFSIGGDAKLYLLERDTSGNFAKRYIESFDDVSRDYRTDRIAILPTDITIYDSVRPPLRAGSDLTSAGTVAVVEAAPSAVHRTAIDPALSDTEIELGQSIHTDDVVMIDENEDTSNNDNITTNNDQSDTNNNFDAPTNTDDTSTTNMEDDTDNTSANDTNDTGTSPSSGSDSSANQGSVFAAGHEFHSYLTYHGQIPSVDLNGGSFRIKCEFSHMNYDDPIVYAGQYDRSHLHMYFGNTTVQYGTTINTLRSQGNATCHGGPLNRSGYWVPSVLAPRHDASGNLLRDSDGNRQANAVTPVGGADATDVYYKAGVDDLQSIQPMPAGLRMVSGNALATGPQDARYFQWQCESTPIRSFEDYSQHIPACPIGDRLYMIIFFPNCWDGINLDSSDHHSHMAYAGAYNWPTPGIVCPSTHPVALPSVSYIMKFEVTSQNAGPDGTSRNWFLSSDMYDLDNNPGGYSIHGDWFMAWNDEIMQTLTQNCLNRGLHCANGELGNGWSLNGGASVGSGNVPDVVHGGMIGPSRNLSEMMGGM